MLQKNQTTILAQIIQVSRTNIMNFKREKSAKVSQENRFDCNKIFIDLAYSYFKKDIYLIEESDGRTQWRTIYEVIYDLCIKSGDEFTNKNFQQCQRNENILQIIQSDTKKKIKAIYL